MSVANKCRRLRRVFSRWEVVSRYDTVFACAMTHRGAERARLRLLERAGAVVTDFLFIRRKQS